jgi:hypothetical protein
MIARVLPFLVPAVFAGALAALGACSSVSNSYIGISAPPYSDQSFQPVGDYVENRCGTLDCHGQVGRNLRIWGCEGMRLEADATPSSCAEQPTTEAEYQATYRSIVGLEPQVMSSVFAGCSSAIAGGDGGAEYPPGLSCHPELLTFIQKPRGLMAHKGGQLICVQEPCPPGLPPQIPFGDSGITVDPQDVCLVTWLEGATSNHYCGLAFGIPSFPIPDAGSE